MTHDRRRRLQEAALGAQAQRREALKHAGSIGDARTRATPRPGDVYTLEPTAAEGILWAVLDRLPSGETMRWVAVAADMHPAVGSADVGVPAGASCGALTLRCAFAVNLDAADFESAHAAGTLPADALRAARNKLDLLQRGAPVGTDNERDTDTDPDYEDWLGDGPRMAHANLLRSRPQGFTSPAADAPSKTVLADAVDALRGLPLTPPAPASQVLTWARQEDVEPGILQLLQHVHHTASQPHLGEPSSPLDPQQQGWAVVWHQAEEPAVKDALAPLIEHRRHRLGGNVQVLEYHDGETWRTWLSRHGVAPGRVEPQKVPGTLLLIGPPTAIPYDFQKVLSVEYAVGRLGFETPDDLRRYCRGLIRRETQPLAERGEAVYVAPGEPLPDDNTTTGEGTSAIPASMASPDARRWRIRRWLGNDATKTRLLQVLADDAERPLHLLWVAAPGLTWPADHDRYAALQGSLLCREPHGDGAITPDAYFSADDLTAAASIDGAVVLLGGSYGAGTATEPVPGLAVDAMPWIPRQPVIAALPGRLLSHPQGAATAVIGSVATVWRTPVHNAPLSRLARDVLDGHTVGNALRRVKAHYAALTSELAALSAKARLGAQPDPARLADLWKARNNARDLIVLGDPLANVHLTLPDDR